MEPTPAPRFGKAQRLGAHRRWSMDLYVLLLDGSWWRTIGLLAVAWLATNLLFACLYWLEPGGLSGARPGNFADAFNFSVQTLSTMGFGGMAPQTPWTNTVVAAEALVGLLETALATGLIFAKFSRPRASALFSRVAVVSTWEGKPALMFRVANQRGNDVVEAAMRVALLRNQVTVDGHEMRRLVDLKLVRQRSPVFSLSWTAIHVIDEHSPLFGVDAASFAAQQMMLIVTLTGFDGTYMQTVHARHAYHHDELRWGYRLVDVISIAPDGTVVLDFEHFHQVVADPPAVVADAPARQSPQANPIATA